MRNHEKTAVSGRLVRLISLMILTVLLLSASPVFARDAVDTGRNASLSVVCQFEGRALDGVVFDLYQVADMDAAGRFSLKPDFSGYSISLAQDSAAGWRALAETLSQYVKRDGLPALDQGSTDVNGKLTFSGLKAGLYLVCGRRYQDGDFTYDSEPFLISLPSLDGSDAWNYDVAVKCKGEGRENFPKTTTVKVLKVWQDAGGEANRPEQIEAQLLRDGEVYETVVLSDANNWRYSWSGLEADHSWSVIEKTVPKDYTLLISREGITFVLTNVYTPSFTEVEVEKIWEDGGHEKERPAKIQVHLLCDGKVYDTVTLDAGNQWKYLWTDLEIGHEWKVEESSALPRYSVRVAQSGGKFTVVNTYVPPETPPGEILPQTGQLWWPIPVLLCAGLLFIVLGLYTGKRNDDEKE